MASVYAGNELIDTHDIAARALDQIPGWSGARLTPLAGGTTNTTWLAEKNGRRATLKADPSRREFPFADRETEAAIQRGAASRGLANDVIYASPTVLLTAFADGDVWTGDDMADEDNQQRLARLLRRVHALPATGRRFDALRAAKLYAARIPPGRSAAPAIVDEHISVLQSLPGPGESRCCHKDVVAGNILATPGLRLIDWEYAADNDPMFDLAVVIVHHDLDDAEAASLLDAYADGRTGQLRARLACEIQRYRALAWLWQAASP